MSAVAKQVMGFKVGGMSHKESGIALATGVGAFIAYSYGVDKLPQWFGVWTNLAVGIGALVVASLVRVPFFSPMIVGAAVVFIADGLLDVLTARGVL